MLNTIIVRFKDPQVIVYGDFNIKREEFIEKVKNKIDIRYKVHINTDTFSITRFRKIKKRIECSYIDYMITCNINCSTFNIIDPPGLSDHLALEIIIPNDELRRLLVNKEIIYSFNNCKNEKDDITRKIKDILIQNKDEVKNKIIDLVDSLRKKYKPHIKVIKGSQHWRTYFYKFIEYIKKVEGKDEITKEDKKSLIKLKKEKLINYLKLVDNEEFISILMNIKKMQLEKNLKNSLY